MVTGRLVTCFGWSRQGTPTLTASWAALPAPDKTQTLPQGSLEGDGDIIVGEVRRSAG